MSNDVTLYGDNLRQGIMITIGDTPLQNVTWINANIVQAVVPGTLPVGTYDVVARNPWASAPATLANVYSVQDPLQDDFFANSSDLWTSPPSILQGDQVLLGLNVHRQGGKQTKQVQVSFYLGDPAHGGQILTTTTTAPMLPGSEVVDSVAFNWNTTGVSSTADIYAVIDPNDLISETSKLNNTVNRAITILPPKLDTIPPTLSSLTINGGAATTDDPQVTIAMVASDIGGSGLHSMYLVDRVYNSSSGGWVAVYNTGWIPYQSTSVMTLTQRGGTHYIQAWVADGQGNISTDVVMQRIDYIPFTDTVRAGQLQVYQVAFSANQAVDISLLTLSGDADLYVWSPDATHSWSSLNSGLTTDVGSFNTGAQAGTYLIEVYGYLDSEYMLDISAPGLSVNGGARSHTQIKSPNAKTPLTGPAIMPDSTPVTNIAVPNAPVVYRAFIPFVSLQPAPVYNFKTYIPFVKVK